MAVRLTPEVERLWFEWLKAGYSGPDLRDVIKYIRRQIAAGKRNEGALKLTNLIQRSETGFIGFDQDLGLSRARANLNIDKRLAPVPDAPASPAAAHGPRQAGGTSAPTPPTAASSPAGHHPPKPAHVDASLRKLREAIE